MFGFSKTMRASFRLLCGKRPLPEGKELERSSSSIVISHVSSQKHLYNPWLPYTLLQMSRNHQTYVYKILKRGLLQCSNTGLVLVFQVCKLHFNNNHTS